MLEGKRIRGELKQSAQTARQTESTGSFEPQRQRIESEAKQNAVEQYKREQGLVNG